MNKKYFWISWAIVLILCLLSLLLLYDGFIDYGVTLFLVLPACIGIITGLLPKKSGAIAGMVLALAAVVLIIFTGRLEGAICVLLALPVIAFFILVGQIISYIIKKLTKKKGDLKLSVVPFVLLLLSAAIEFAWNGSGKYSEVTTSIELQCPDSVVFNHIKKVDTVIASATILHQLGLPYPRKCILTAEKIGGQRICKFDEGTITETITNLKTNELLVMSVTGYDMPGKNWFSFEKDLYEIEKKSNSVIITRTTGYFSKLKPRFYWEWVEKATIGAEQGLVFDNLKNEIASSLY